MKLAYHSFAEAENNFKWSERWEVFDKGQEELNIAHECIDRHPKEKAAMRIKNSDGSREIYTFGDLSRLTSQFANMLERRGIKPGERVAIILNLSREYYISFFGILKRGAVAVPCYALFGPEGIEYRLKASNAKMAIINRESADKIKPGLVEHLIIAEELQELIQNEDDSYIPRTSADTLAVIQFSSGTTGQPRQVLYTHSAMSITAVFTKFWIGLREGDRYMCTSSPAWGHGIWYGTVGPLLYGNELGVHSGKFEPESLLEVLEEFEITVMSAIPRVYKAIMACGKIGNYKLKLRQLSYSGSEMDREVAKYFLDKLGIYIASNYGNTEVGPIIIDFAFDDWKYRLGSAGKPMLGIRIGILDENGNEMPPGETGQVAVWRKGNWNLVGDYGYFDEDGYFWPQGRSDDVIKSSGYRIGPFEIETVLEKHPAVQRSAVVGSPDPERGEIVKAFITLNPHIKPSDELKSEIQAFVKKHLSMHEYPREVEFVAELPETPDGKLRRKLLKQREYERKGKKLAI